MSQKANGAEWRNRIKEIREVSAAELRANPLNWRRHPERQQETLRGLLGEIGIVLPLVAYYSKQAKGALTLIDGHLRHEQGGKWPCAILDVDDDEAEIILATLDPLVGWAEMDPSALLALLNRSAAQSVADDAIRSLLDELSTKATVSAPEPPEQEEPELDSEHVIEIFCSDSDLAYFQRTLDVWSSRPGVKVHIS